MRNGRKKIAFGITYKPAYGIQVGKKLLDTLFPDLRSFRFIARWPVLIGPLGRCMLHLQAEFQDVPLRNADMLQQLPRRMWSTFRLLATKFPRKFFKRAAYINVGFCFGQKIDDVLSERRDVHWKKIG